MLKDTTKEIAEMQNSLWLKKSPRERAKAVFGMFTFSKKIIVSTLPSNLSEKEFTQQLYERIYGEPLPEDFFRE